MNVPGNQLSLRRYRRRILGWGAAGIIGVFAAGAAIFVPRVEADLGNRVVDEFNDAEVGPVTASFSGQDGTLFCNEGPVDIPDDLLERSRDLWGVDSLDVDSSCASAAQLGIDDGDDGDNDDSSGGTEVPDATSPTTTSALEPAPTAPPADVDTVASLVANGSQFSTLEGLLADTGLDSTLAGDGPFTLFAPTNAAFQELGPDAIAALGRDSELLATVLSHHVTAGAVTSADLSDGDVEMLDETTVAVDLSDGVTITSGESVATVTEADLVADNGVVHAIDAVLIPAGVTVGAETAALVTAEVVDGQVVLRGTVATEAQRDELIAAASTQIDPSNVIDELVIDASSAVADADFDGLVNLAPLLAPNLVSGEATLTASELSLTGVYATDEQNEAITGASADVEFDLTQRTDAGADDAAALEADLNALVLANPILFDPNSTTISDESAATLDRVAALANRIGGVAIEIQGHTDTDGLPATNQQLSEGRAASVSVALVERGIAAESLTSSGFGGSEPIVDSAGVEDKAASRRVEFVVTVQ